MRQNEDSSVRPEPFHIASLQRQQIVEDVVRLLYLQEVCDELGSQLACKSSLQWRLGLAMELVASPALLIIHGAHPGKPWCPLHYFRMSSAS